MTTLKTKLTSLLSPLESLNAISLGWWAVLMSVASIAPYLQDVNIPLPPQLYLFKIACPLVWFTVFFLVFVLQLLKIYLSTPQGTMRLKFKSYVLKRIAYGLDAWLLPKVVKASPTRRILMVKLSMRLKERILYPLAPLTRFVAFLSLGLWAVVFYSVSGQFTNLHLSLYPFLVAVNATFYLKGVTT